MVGNIMVDITTVIIDNDNVSFTLNWDEPFANFDPIVNYTITINCNDALLCPVMLTVTTTSASVNFTTNLSMMTPLSVTASNTVDVSDPTTIMIGGKLLYLYCGTCIHVYTYVRTYVCSYIIFCNMHCTSEDMHTIYIHTYMVIYVRTIGVIKI